MISNIKKPIVYSFLVIFILSNFTLSSQIPEGLPFIKNYGKEYFTVSGVLNGAISSNDIVYFGTSKGIVIFDGNFHKEIYIENAQNVRSIAVDTNGIVYIGGQGEIGILEPDNNNNPAYRNITNKIPEDYRDFWNVHRTIVTDNGVLFSTDNYIFIYKNNTINVLTIDEGLLNIYKINDEIYLQLGDFSFAKFIDNNIVKINNSIIDEIRISIFLPYDIDKYLIFGRNKFYIFSPNSSTTLFEEANDFDLLADKIVNKSVNWSTIIDDSTFIITTQRAGLFIFNKNGTIINNLNSANGLISDLVTNAFVDSRKNIWATTIEGVSYISYNSPFRIFNDLLGLTSHAYHINMFENTLFVAGSHGAYRTNNSVFQLIDNTNNQNWQVIKIDGHIYDINNVGILEIINNKAQFLGYYYPWKLIPLQQHPGYVWGVTDGAPALFKTGKEGLEFIREIKGFEGSQRYCFEDFDGKMWVANPATGIYRLTLNADLDSVSVEFFDMSSGLPDNSDNIINIFSPLPMSFYHDKEKIPVVFTKKGIYHFNYDSKTFYPDTTTNNFFADWNAAYPSAQDTFGNIYFDNDYFKAIKPSPNGGFEILDIAFNKFKNKKYTVYDIKNFGDKVYLGGEEGIIVYDVLNKSNINSEFFTLIKRISSGDSILFGGYKLINSSMPFFNLDYKNRNLLIEVSAIFYEDYENNNYSYFLDGYDDTWSSWTDNPKKEYTNLHEGDYTFKVKAMNVYDQESIVTEFSFKIHPPWYRTILAYIIYVFSALTLIWLLIKYNTKKLERENDRLEQTVKERTFEIYQQNEEIQSQNDLLLEQKEELIEKNIIIEDKNKKIFDSINYASRIQSAILPNFDKLDLTDYFILFKPRDIVSGDFFWSKKIKDKKIIVAADCTGHGVPGALMSMLGIAQLEYISKSLEFKRDFTAADILEILRKSVKNILQQDEHFSKTKDAMDMVLTVVDTKTMTLQYSGANNPLIIIRKDEKLTNIEQSRRIKIIEYENKTLIQYNADPQPVGIHLRELPFTNHEIKIKTGDLIYMFSDGYLDQIGGEKNYKFMIKQFKQLLLQISDLPMKKQKEILDKKITDWMKNYTQMDDILVVGFEV